MSSISICNLVRALSKPYVGASCIIKNEEFKIWSVSIGKYKNKNIEPGKILSINNNNIEVKTGDGSIIITDHEFDQTLLKNDYLSL